MSKGWIKLHRSMFDNDLWTAEPFTKGQAWIDLIVTPTIGQHQYGFEVSKSALSAGNWHGQN